MCQDHIIMGKCHLTRCIKKLNNIVNSVESKKTVDSINRKLKRKNRYV